MTLVKFLTAMIDLDEDGAVAAAVAGPKWKYADSYGSMQIESEDGTNITHDQEGLSDSVRGFAGPHIARHDPARALREVEAKRRIIERARLVLDSWARAEAGQGGAVSYPDVTRRERSFWLSTLADMAAVYSDHPDYRVFVDREGEFIR